MTQPLNCIVAHLCAKLRQRLTQSQTTQAALAEALVCTAG